MRCTFAMAYTLTLHLRRRLGSDKHSSPEQGRGGEKPAAVTTAIRCCVCMTKCRSGTWEREVKIGTELKFAPFPIDSCDPVEFDLSVCPSMSRAGRRLRSLAATITALPSMSLIPSAPFR
jgi:hypothetical protein